MTEQEYTNVRDLSNVMQMYSLLCDILIEFQPNIPRQEYIDVIGKVYKWRKLIFDSIDKEIEITND